MKHVLFFLAVMAVFALSGCTAIPYGELDAHYDYGYANFPDRGYHHDHDHHEEGDRDDRGEGRDDD